MKKPFQPEYEIVNEVTRVVQESFLVTYSLSCKRADLDTLINKLTEYRKTLPTAKQYYNWDGETQ